MLNQTISHYQILSKLGSGGMGVVYKARDTKLDRFVALKFLPPHLSEDETEKQRFIHEAKAASSLDHPNICTIYEINETEDGQMFIAMAYYDGATLQKKVSSDQLSVDSVLDIAMQIASGLAKAHEHGITHRDLKPANVMLTKEGVVKILDFGLAKLAGRTKLTQTGSTMGTAAYMSPEQVQGLPTDSRTDIWSLGVVMYEMLTGKLPFAAEYDQAVMYAIVNLDPAPARSLNAEIPVALESIVHKCLAQELEQRYQNLRDWQADVKSFQTGELPNLANNVVVSRAQRQRKRRRLLWSSAVATLTMLSATLLYFSTPLFKPELPPMKTTTLTTLPGVERFPAFSPDGKMIAFSNWNQEKGDLDIHVQIIGTHESRRITDHPANDGLPNWSPDGRHIAFLRWRPEQRAEGIFMIPALGGTEQKISSVNANDLNWSPDGKLLAFTDADSNKSIFLLTLENRRIRRLTTAPAGESWIGHYSPTFSPDGRTVAFVAMRSMRVSELYTISVDGGEPKRVTFDEKDVGSLAWMPNGREIIFDSDRGEGRTRLWRVSSNGGSPQPLAVIGRNLSEPAISPDGRFLAYTEFTSSGWNIARVAIPESPNQKAIPSRLLSSTAGEGFPQFSPDGKRIVFASGRSGSFQIWVCDSDGKNPIQVTNLEAVGGSPQWSRDGKNIVFDARPEGHADLFVISAEGGAPRQLTSEPTDEIVPTWSHDGEWVYFGSDRSGEMQIWKIPSSGGKTTQVTKDGGFRAFESSDEKWVYYSSQGPSPIWKIPVEGGAKSVVLDSVLHWQAWSLEVGGICYVKPAEEGRADVMLLNLTTMESQKIARADDYLRIRMPSISPDGRWLIYQKGNPLEAEIVLVENFR